MTRASYQTFPSPKMPYAFSGHFSLAKTEAKRPSKWPRQSTTICRKKKTHFCERSSMSPSVKNGLNFQENEKTHQATFTNFRKSTRQTNRQNTPRHLNFQTNYERNVFIYSLLVMVTFRVCCKGMLKKTFENFPISPRKGGSTRKVGVYL